MAVGADALRVDAQFLGVTLYPSYGGLHVLDAGGQRSLLHQSVVHVADHVALHGIVDHQRAVNHVVLRPGAPSAAVDNQDGGPVGLRSEQRLRHVEYSTWAYVGAIGHVLSHGNLLLLRLGCHRECQQEQKCCSS